MFQPLVSPQKHLGCEADNLRDPETSHVPQLACGWFNVPKARTVLNMLFRVTHFKYCSLYKSKSLLPSDLNLLWDPAENPETPGLPPSGRWCRGVWPRRRPPFSERRGLRPSSTCGGARRDTPWSCPPGCTPWFWLPRPGSEGWDLHSPTKHDPWQLQVEAVAERKQSSVHKPQKNSFLMEASSHSLYQNPNLPRYSVPEYRS